MTNSVGGAIILTIQYIKGYDEDGIDPFRPRESALLRGRYAKDLILPIPSEPEIREYAQAKGRRLPSLPRHGKGLVRAIRGTKVQFEWYRGFLPVSKNIL